MKIKLENKELEYSYPGTPENCVFLRGRANKPLIKLPDEWEEFVDLTSISVHLTPIGANQNLIVKRTQGLEVHLQTNGLPVDCYYLIFGEVLDKAL
jgi:hypothetical protein